MLAGEKTSDKFSEHNKVSGNSLAFTLGKTGFTATISGDDLQVTRQAGGSAKACSFTLTRGTYKRGRHPQRC